MNFRQFSNTETLLPSHTNSVTLQMPPELTETEQEEKKKFRCNNFDIIPSLVHISDNKKLLLAQNPKLMCSFSLFKR